MDSSRNRPVPIRLYMPGDARIDRPVPLILFSHGMGGSRSGYQYLATHWARQGIASLHPQHVGSDNSLWRGNPLDLVQRLQHAAREEEAVDRVRDLRFVTDQILASEWRPLIDAGRIAAAGHSYGASTAMLASGARVRDRELRQTDLRDERIRAAILISAPPFVGQGSLEDILGQVRIPTLHITSINDTIRIPGYTSTVEDRISIFQAMGGMQKTLAVFNTGGHSIFTDRITSSGPETSTRIKSATRELATTFLRDALVHAGTVAGETTQTARRVDNTVSDTQGELAQWLLRHQDIIERFVTPKTTIASR
jgi:predicted dienelactone hydrolase